MNEISKEQFIRICGTAAWSEKYGMNKSFKRDIFDKDLVLMGKTLREWWAYYNISKEDEIEMLRKCEKIQDVGRRFAEEIGICLNL